MQYCVVRIRVDAEDQIDAVEWGPLDGHPMVLISEVRQDGVEEVLQTLRRGKLVWASFPTPFGTTLGGLLRIGRSRAGRDTLELVPSAGRPKSVLEIARF